MIPPLVASAAVFCASLAITKLWPLPQHDWGKWREWSFDKEGSRWILSKPPVRQCQTCQLKQRYRWWRQ